MGGQRHAPVALPPGKTRYPLYRRLGGPHGPFWTGAENLDPRTVQPVASRYTDWAIAAHIGSELNQMVTNDITERI